ncbi:uncharacterized protein LOC446926 isoform X1 [Xenopus laevis]|uniref:Uncharacterized protein LOC446926 isoform X1 n=1 Tax=Xenopus laevis TaxID=8355 RepID=A0A8J0U7J5_XENLA|nr:uncharacterized protein LOC446926 isoform X1 [Xenopus laevis]
MKSWGPTEDVRGAAHLTVQKRKWHPGVLLFISALLCSTVTLVTGCNKALCASDVSKCLLQELCQCQAIEGNCSCCPECMLCMGNLWDQCCDCVGLCSKNKESRKHSARRSSLEELPVPVPSLFRAVSSMQEGESALGWTSHSLPIREELAQSTHMDHILLGAHSVLYFNSCMSMRRCHQSCESVGSTKYRWFHNGCCQCVGPDCHGYGSKEPICRQCQTKEMMSEGKRERATV